MPETVLLFQIGPEETAKMKALAARANVPVEWLIGAFLTSAYDFYKDNVPQLQAFVGYLRQASGAAYQTEEVANVH